MISNIHFTAMAYFAAASGGLFCLLFASGDSGNSISTLFVQGMLCMILIFSWITWILDGIKSCYTNRLCEPGNALPMIVANLAILIVVIVQSSQDMNGNLVYGLVSGGFLILSWIFFFLLGRDFYSWMESRRCFSPPIILEKETDP